MISVAAQMGYSSLLYKVKIWFRGGFYNKSVHVVPVAFPRALLISAFLKVTIKQILASYFGHNCHFQEH